MINHFKQVHTSHCEPTCDHVGCDESSKLAVDHMKQAHNDEADDSDDPTTVNTNEKEVKDSTIET